jgi:hypothetical protein
VKLGLSTNEKEDLSSLSFMQKVESGEKTSIWALITW